METFELGVHHPTALISKRAALGENVTVGAFTVIHDGVEIGDNTVIGPHCVLGEPTAAFYGGGQSEIQACVIGADSVIRSHTVIYQGAEIGPGFECGHRVTIREGSKIGRGVRTGTMSDLQGDLTIGDYTRLHSNVFVPGRSTIGRYVWIFPHVVLTNDPHPPSDSCTVGPAIHDFAAIAARSVIMPGVTIGESSLVGAASLVTSDVGARRLVVGSPARDVGPTDEVVCRHFEGEARPVYPWPDHFRRGYPAGALPDVSP